MDKGGAREKFCKPIEGAITRREKWKEGIKQMTEGDTKDEG